MADVDKVEVPAKGNAVTGVTPKVFHSIAHAAVADKTLTIVIFAGFAVIWTTANSQVPGDKVGWVALAVFLLCLLAAVYRIVITLRSDSELRIKTVRRPRVLFVTTPGFDRNFDQPGFEGPALAERELQQIKSNLRPALVEVRNCEDSNRLMTEIISGEFDIAHLLGDTDERDGSFVFLPDSEDPNARIGARALATALATAGVELVVLPNSRSLALCAQLARVARVVALDWIAPPATTLAWEILLYQMLGRGKTLSEAHEVASGGQIGSVCLLNTDLRLKIRSAVPFEPPNQEAVRNVQNAGAPVNVPVQPQPLHQPQ